MAVERRMRVLSGMRPTGALHIGHLVGALENWIRLQESHDCFYVIVDWHALTTDYSDTSGLRGFIHEIALDWLAAGLDPAKSDLFVQSAVKEHAELHLLLSMIVPLPWLERVPTYKEQQEQLRDRDLNTYGFLGYPLLQAADILLYKADLVPVGEDQMPHLEMCREVARRFNHAFRDVFPEPQPKLTHAPRLPGTDGRKMSKSYGNAIFLGDSPETVARKVDSYLTDPQRTHRHVPGNPEVCPVYANHGIFSSADQLAWAADGCRTARIGCRDCKAVLRDNLRVRLAPIAARRLELQEDPEAVDRILSQGADRARDVARGTMAEVRAAMRIG